MALMVPEDYNARCNDNVTQGEKEVFKLLKSNLSNNYTVYFDTNIENRYPDFVIVGKDVGIIVLEIKDYKINTISQPPRGSGDLIIKVNEIEKSDKVEKKVNPYDQARGYINKIKNKFNFAFKYNYNSIVVFPYLKEEELSNKYIGYDKCLNKNKTIYQEDLDCVINGEQSLEDLLKEKCEHLYYNYKLSDENVKKINEYIYPLSEPNLKRLEENKDKEIEDILNEFEQGKYVLQGVSGSGKTIYLKTFAKIRSKLIKQHGFKEKILLTAFNNTLISSFKSEFKNNEYIDIKTKYELINQRDKEEKYGLILIDEGQDFSLDNLKYIIDTYSCNSQEPYFVIAMDGAQNIYKEKNFKISELGENIKIEKLNQNYRNNKSIFEFSNLFLNCNSPYETEKYKLGESNYIIDDYKSVKEDKESVKIEYYSTFESQMDKIISHIKEYNCNEKDMCIMYISSKTDSEDYFNNKIKEYLDEYGIKSYDFYNNKKSLQSGFVDNHINISTIHSSKGFEYKIVFLCGIEEKYLKVKNDLKKLVYTGMTRAKEELIIFMPEKEKNDIIKTLEKTYQYMDDGKDIKCINCGTSISKFDKYCYECAESYLFNIDIKNHLKCKKCNSYNNLGNLYCTICSNKL